MKQRNIEEKNILFDVTDPAGISIKAYTYDAFGNEKNQLASDTNPFRYCGEYLDRETNEY